MLSKWRLKVSSVAQRGPETKMGDFRAGWWLSKNVSIGLNKEGGFSDTATTRLLLISCVVTYVRKLCSINTKTSSNLFLIYLKFIMDQNLLLHQNVAALVCV